MTVSVQIMRNTSQGMAPMLLMMPISWKRSKTDIRMVLITPTMAMRMAMTAIEKTITLAVETRLMIVVLDLGHRDHLDVGQVVERFSRAVMLALRSTLMPDRGQLALLAELLLQRPQGDEDRAVVLGARALQDADDRELDVLVGDEQLVADLALLELGRLVAEHGLARLGVREPGALLELQERLHLPGRSPGRRRGRR